MILADSFEHMGLHICWKGSPTSPNFKSREKGRKQRPKRRRRTRIFPNLGSFFHVGGFWWLEDPKQSKEKSKAKAKKSKSHGKDEDEISTAGKDVFDEETPEIERSEMKDGQETSNEPGQTEELQGVDESMQPEFVQDIAIGS